VAPSIPSATRRSTLDRKIAGKHRRVLSHNEICL
jgi:hypothetical protein